jgi:DnaJ-class molecular chaperone
VHSTCDGEELNIEVTASRLVNCPAGIDEMTSITLLPGEGSESSKTFTSGYAPLSSRFLVTILLRAQSNK